MSSDAEYSLSERRKIFNALFVPVIVALLMVLSLLLENGMGWDFHQGGIYPRRPDSLWAVFSYVFVHAGWGHLINNVISFVVLGGCLFYFYRTIALKVFMLSWIFSGLLLWVIGRDAWHVGASGWIYALAFFIFLSGIIRKHISLIAISLIIVFNYGNMVWHVFPWEVNDPISWEGHLSGAIVGLVLAVVYRKQGPQKLKDDWDDEEEDENEEDEDESDFDSADTRHYPVSHFLSEENGFQ